MNFHKIKKISTSEIKEKFKKSKFDLLTNENDFLVKSLKKPGQSLGLTKLYFLQEITLIPNLFCQLQHLTNFKDFKIS